MWLTGSWPSPGMNTKPVEASADFKRSLLRAACLSAHNPRKRSAAAAGAAAAGAVGGANAMCGTEGEAL